MLLPSRGFLPLRDAPFDLFVGNSFPSGKFFKTTIYSLSEVEFVHNVFHRRLVRHLLNHLQCSLLSPLGYKFPR